MGQIRKKVGALTLHTYLVINRTMRLDAVMRSKVNPQAPKLPFESFYNNRLHNYCHPDKTKTA